jgi:hypothetical protein
MIRPSRKPTRLPTLKRPFAYRVRRAFQRVKVFWNPVQWALVITYVAAALVIYADATWWRP